MSPQERYSYTEPELCHYHGDVTKAWFVYFDFTDHLTGRTVRKQYRSGINYWPTKEDRLKQGNALKLFWKQKLQRGWNPFAKTDIRSLPANYTIIQALDGIMAVKLPLLRTRAVQTYTYVSRFFKEWLEKEKLHNLQLRQFTSELASEYMDHLVISRNYSGRTHNDHLLILKTFFNAMIERKWTAENPFRGIKKKPVEVGRNHAYSEEEKEALKNLLYQRDRRMYFFSQIMYYCFIRRSELAGLKIKDIDLVNHTITIPADVSKNKNQESVVIPVGLEPVLKQMNLHQYHPEDYLFGAHLLTCSVQYKNVNHISTRHNKFLSKLKISREKGLYSWKHSGVCTAYYATGKDIYALLRQLRHKDLNTTQIYLKSLGLVNNDVFRNAMVA